MQHDDSPGAVTARSAVVKCNGLECYEVEYTSHGWMPLHHHETTSLAFILNGWVTHDCRQETHLLQPCTLAFLPAGELHADRFHSGVRTFQMELASPWLERFRQIAALPDTPSCYHNSLPAWIAMRLRREFQRRDSLTPLILEGLVLELFVEMIRGSTDCAEIPLPRWLRQTRDLLHARFLESLSLETIATSVGVHPSHLTRAFRQHYRCTIGEYVRRLRVEYACHLLSTSEMSPSQIAHAAGFSDQSHFSRTFKSIMGMTPVRFQKDFGQDVLRQEKMR